MNKTTQHTYQILTKRTKRLAELSGELNLSENIWQGVSVESDTFVNRINELRKADARIRFLSLEPLTGPISSLDIHSIN